MERQKRLCTGEERKDQLLWKEGGLAIRIVLQQAVKTGLENTANRQQKKVNLHDRKFREEGKIPASQFQLLPFTVEYCENDNNFRLHYFSSVISYSLCVFLFHCPFLSFSPVIDA